MNLENLKKYVGTLQSYNNICKTLEEETKTSNSKIKQLKEWSTYFKFEKIKSNYKILEVYDKQFGLSARSKFISAVEAYINMMIKSEKNNVFSYNEIFKFMRLVNNEYFVAKYDRDYVFKLRIPMPNKIFEDSWDTELEYSFNRFIQTSRKLIIRKLKNAFQSMEDRGLYKVEYGYKYGKRVGRKLVSRECTREEKDEIDKVTKERQIQEYGDVENLHLHYYNSPHHIRKQIKDDIENLTSKKYGYTYHFDCVKFIKLKDNLHGVSLADLNKLIITTLSDSDELDKVVITKGYLINKFIDLFIKI